MSSENDHRSTVKRTFVGSPSERRPRVVDSLNETARARRVPRVENAFVRGGA